MSNRIKKLLSSIFFIVVFLVLQKVGFLKQVELLDQHKQVKTQNADVGSQTEDLGSVQKDETENEVLKNSEHYTLVRAVDGDTLVVFDNEYQEKKVRLIGVNTPETVDPRRPVECFGKEASKFTKDLVVETTSGSSSSTTKTSSGSSFIPNTSLTSSSFAQKTTSDSSSPTAKTLSDSSFKKNIRLEFDKTQQKYDKYGRLLAYVYLVQNTVNEHGKKVSKEIFLNQELIKQGYAHEYTYKLPYKFQSEFKKLEQEAKAGKRGLWSQESNCQKTNY